MRTIFYLLPMLGINAFFSVSALAGYQYLGNDSSIIYILYNAVIAILGIVVFFRYLLSKETRIRRNELLILAIPFIYIFIFLIEVIIHGSNEKVLYWFLLFVLWSVPAIYVAYTVSKTQIILILPKWIEIFGIIFSLGSINSILIPYAMGIQNTGLGGATYQTASYTSALSFGILLYFYWFGSNHIRFNFTKLGIYKWILLILALMNSLCVFISGGRGGFVLLTLYIMIFIINIIKIKRFSTLLNMIFIIVISCVLIYSMSENIIFRAGFERVISFIDFEHGINWEGTSERDRVYSDALFIINEKPILGHGIFSYWLVTDYPHNIFLEVLLGGGIVYFVLVTCALIFTFFKLIRMIKYDPNNRIWLIIFLYPITMLMFSGTYLSSQEFWFIIILLITYRVPKENRLINSEIN